MKKERLGQLSSIIEEEAYEDLLQANGWGELEMTVMDHHPKQTARKILSILVSQTKGVSHEERGNGR